MDWSLEIPRLGLSVDEAEKLLVDWLYDNQTGDIHPEEAFVTLETYIHNVSLTDMPDVCVNCYRICQPREMVNSRICFDCRVHNKIANHLRMNEEERIYLFSRFRTVVYMA